TCQKKTCSGETPGGSAVPSQNRLLASNFLKHSRYLPGNGEFNHELEGSATNSSPESWLTANAVTRPRVAKPALECLSGDQFCGKIGELPRVSGQAEIGAGKSHPHQPIVEFRRPLQPEQVAQIERVVEGGRLVVQHDIVGARHS